MPVDYLKLKYLMFFLLSLNNNNYMTYCWPNSAFFNFQSLLIKGIADNILAFFFWQIGTNGCTCKKANVSIYLYISVYEQLVENRRMYDQGYISVCFIRLMIQPRLCIPDMPVKHEWWYYTFSYDIYHDQRESMKKKNTLNKQQIQQRFFECVKKCPC